MVAIYWDANALVDAVEKEGSALPRVMARLRSKGWSLLTSELSIAEVLVVPIRQEKAELMAIYDELLGNGRLVATIPVDRAVLIESAAVRARSSQKLPDSILVATASLAGCRFLVSSDKGLRLPKGLDRVAIEDAETIGT